MKFDTSSFDSFLRDLNLTRAQVTTHTGRGMMSFLPRPVFDAALALGLGRFVIDTPKTQEIATNMGVPLEMLAAVARAMRRRAEWRPAWERLATTTAEQIAPLIKSGDQAAAARQIKLAIILLGLAYGGDGDFIHTPLPVKQERSPAFQKLYAQLRAVTGEVVQPLELTHVRGITLGLLHLPPTSTPPFPALLALPPLASDKDYYDFGLTLFRQAGYATLTIDLPGHGASFGQSHAQYDDEVIYAQILETLAALPGIDAQRVGVLGGSFGAFFALRTAAVSSRAKVCVAFASPFDIGQGLPDAVHGIQDNFTYVAGAKTLTEALVLSKEFSLDRVISRIKCPMCLVHGTSDHICDFTVPYEIARRATAPLAIFPLMGVDHEASTPSTLLLAQPALAWLKNNL